MDQIQRRKSISLVLYAFHLLVPLLVIAEWIINWQDVDGSQVWNVILGIAAIWLVGGLILLGRILKGAMPYRWAGEVLLTVYSFIVFAAFAEVGLRVLLSSQVLLRKQYIYPPSASYTLLTDQQDTPGINGKKLFKTNELGFRGYALPEDESIYRIITVGGSTTECAVLDQKEQWPELLMTNLNRAQSSRPIWVANAGIAGHTAVHHRRLVQTVPNIRKGKMLIFLSGINDLVTAMAFEGGSTERPLEEASAAFLEEFFLYGSLCQPRALMERSIIFQLSLQPFRKYIQGPWSNLDRRNFHGALRLARIQSARLPMADMQFAAKEYQNRIHAIAEECRKQGYRCLFLTQPTMWRDDLPAYERNLLWLGNIGVDRVKGYADVGAMARAMALFNQSMLNVCRRDGFECYDLAAAVPKDTTAFFDDCHFNENGSRIVAGLLSEYLLSTSPWRETADKDKRADLQVVHGKPSPAQLTLAHSSENETSLRGDN